MSYDLDLFTPQPNLDAITIIQQAALYPASAHTPLNERLMQALTALNPHLQTMASVQRVEIFDAAEGIRISLYTRIGHVAVPYWFRDEQQISQVFAHVRHYVRVIQEISDYALYDPQLARVVDLEQDYFQMLDMYQRTSLAMQDFFGEV